MWGGGEVKGPVEKKLKFSMTKRNVTPLWKKKNEIKIFEKGENHPFSKFDGERRREGGLFNWDFLPRFSLRRGR